ncbi:cytochrome c, partial [uncultured Cyclobacterium sp.]|uniref:c-type cytochrome n=1 Tax=uncultured Cyclobacterium sp. TaxID=453820 RepID=UPI0030EB8CEA
MKKKVIKILALLVLQFSFLALSGFAQESGKLYKTYCAGCHGANLEGNSASSLIKTAWKYGRSRSLMTRNITFGIPGTEMIAWNQVLNKEQIRSLVDYISDAQEIQPNIDRSIPQHIQSEKYDLQIEEWVVDAIKTPWAIEFVSKDSALVSERRGMLR